MPGRFAPQARIRAKVVCAEDDGDWEKETDRRNNKTGGQQAGEEEGGATSICDDILLVHGCQQLLLYGLFERAGNSNAGRVPAAFSKRTRSATPASSASWRARSIDGGWKSKPANCDLG